jgi:hypothetical protein
LNKLKEAFEETRSAVEYCNHLEAQLGVLHEWHKECERVLEIEKKWIKTNKNDATDPKGGSLRGAHLPRHFLPEIPSLAQRHLSTYRYNSIDNTAYSVDPDGCYTDS